MATTLEEEEWNGRLKKRAGSKARWMDREEEKGGVEV